MIGAVIIGRNEGDRLVRCLASLQGRLDHMIYVDSGSTDDSVKEARRAGAIVVELDISIPFTAARARNAGFERLKRENPGVEFVQFIDGDCEMRSGWIEAGMDFLKSNPKVAAVCGRLRERFPEVSVYNQMADDEWSLPVGPLKAVGGIAMFRASALNQVGGYDETLIAGEEPELCVRLRARSWLIQCIDVEMAWHDSAMTRFGQWWKRSQRTGYTYAEGAEMHGAPPERHYVEQRRRAVLWGLVLPLLTVIGVLLTPWAWGLLLIWPVQVLRLRSKGETANRAIFLTLGKIPEAQGLLSYYFSRLRNKRVGLIEYK